MGILQRLLHTYIAFSGQGNGVGFVGSTFRKPFPVYTLREREDLRLPGIEPQFLGHPTSSLVTILTELSQVHISTSIATVVTYCVV
jgi:hypothetical protein